MKFLPLNVHIKVSLDATDCLFPKELHFELLIFEMSYNCRFECCPQLCSKSENNSIHSLLVIVQVKIEPISEFNPDVLYSVINSLTTRI